MNCSSPPLNHTKSEGKLINGNSKSRSFSVAVLSPAGQPTDVAMSDPASAQVLNNTNGEGKS